MKTNWKKEILNACIIAEKIYQLESDKTDKSWLAIYNANVIEKISSLLQQQRKEIVEMIEGKNRKFVSEPAEYKESDANVWREGYNQALQEIINSLK